MTTNKPYPLAAVAFDGADAAHFLQGQLTINSETLAANTWRRAAYCSRQGRMIACGLLLRWADDDAGQHFLWVMHDDIAATLASQLQRFVLRAKVKISQPALYFSAVVAKEAKTPALPQGSGAIDLYEDTAIARINEGDGSGIIFNRAEMSPEVWQAQCAQRQTITADAWQQNEAQRAVPWVNTATQDMFIPQFLNFDLLGGVDFEKGCFVGQEVIARLHHLGNVKRRGMVVSATSGGCLSPAMVIKTAEGKTAGEVVNSVATPQGCIAFAAIVKELAEQELWAEEHALHITPPPYPIIEAEKFKRQKTPNV